MNSLKQKRKELGLTQVEAAQICGVSRRSFQYYEENDEYEEMRRKILEIIENSEKNRILGLQFIKLTCAQIFKKYPEIRCAYLYGSYPMEMKFYHLVGELKEALGKQVDLQTHRQIGDNEKFLENILVDGILLYKKSLFKNSR